MQKIILEIQVLTMQFVTSKKIDAHFNPPDVFRKPFDIQTRQNFWAAEATRSIHGYERKWCWSLDVSGWFDEISVNFDLNDKISSILIESLALHWWFPSCFYAIEICMAGCIRWWFRRDFQIVEQWSTCKCSRLRWTNSAGKDYKKCFQYASDDSYPKFYENYNVVQDIFWLSIKVQLGCLNLWRILFWQHLASSEGHFSTVQLLLERHADVQNRKAAYYYLLSLILFLISLLQGSIWRICIGRCCQTWTDCSTGYIYIHNT